MNETINMQIDPTRTETPQEYWNRIQRSISDIEHGKGITFSREELKSYLNDLIAPNHENEIPLNPKA